MKNYCPECGVETSVKHHLCDKCLQSFRSRKNKTSTLPAGTILKQKYFIQDLIKIGESGNIYMALDKKSNKNYAIKERSTYEITSIQEKEYIINQFMNEYKLLSGLNHSRIPRAIDYFIIDENYYLIIDYIEGKDLQRIIDENGNSGPGAKEVVDWGIQLCELLEFLHNRKTPIIYRDLKPSNIMLRDKDKAVFLIDFGIACPYRSDTSGLSRTRIGTVGYMPPEQFHGKYFPASDIFALGATIYYLLTGKVHVLFGYKPMNSINSEIPEELDNIVQHSLEIIPSKRFKTATEMKIELKNFLRSDRYTTHVITELDLWIGELESTDRRNSRLKIINTLQRFSEPRAIQTLARILTEDKDAHCRQAAANSLGKIKDPDSIDIIIKQAEEDRNIKVRATCIENLSNFKDPIIYNYLINFLQNKNGAIRKSAAIAIANFGNTKAIEPLKKAREKEGIFTIGTRMAIDKAIEKLKEIKKEEDKEKKKKEIEEKISFPEVFTGLKHLTEVQYEEKDKIYIKLIYELFDNESEVAISLILNNKAKLDKRFFQLLDYEYNIFVENNQKRADALTYLMEVMENLRAPGIISPPYKPSQKELEELASADFEKIKGIKEKVEKKKGPSQVKRVLSEKAKKTLWKKAANEFPENRMMQEYYFFKMRQEYLTQDSAVKKKIRKESRYKITGETLKSISHKIDVKKLGPLLNQLLTEENLTNKLIDMRFREKEIELILSNTNKVKVKSVKKKSKTRSLKPRNK